MENENEQPQEEQETVVEEETAKEEEPQKPQEESITLSKSDYTKLQRQAIAYKAIKDKPIINQDNTTIDQIKLGKKLVDYSDEELDFVVDYAKSKKPEDVLKALENPFVQAGIKAQREKVEKERLTLKPSGTQSESDEPITLEEALNQAKSSEEKEKLLKDAGLITESNIARKDRFNADRLH